MCQMCHGFSKKPQGRCFSPCSKQGCGVTEASDEVDELVDLGVCVCVCVCVEWRRGEVVGDCLPLCSFRIFV